MRKKLHQKVFFVYQTLSVRKLSVRTMEQGNVTPEHTFQEVEMFHSPDNTLLRDGQDAPPTKRQRGLGLSWVVTSRMQIVNDQGGLYSAASASDQDYKVVQHLMDSKLRVARAPVLSHQKKVYTWKCKSEACSKHTRLIKLWPNHPNTNSGKYTYIFETSGDHTCEINLGDNTPTGKFTAEMKIGIDYCLRNGMTQPRQILAYFLDQGLQPPNKKQITNYKSRGNSPKPNDSTTTGQMSEWCQAFVKTEDHEKIENQDRAFVVDYHIDHNKKTFRIGISTMRLLNLLSSQFESGNPIMLHSDATYKIDLESYPGTLYGSSDKHRRFHMHLFGLSWSETEDDYEFFFKLLKDACCGNTTTSATEERPTPLLYLMMDDAPAIHNGAKRQFPTIVRCMCFAHVYMNMSDTHLSFARGDSMLHMKTEFLRDLVHVACSWSKQCFQLALTLMCEKYCDLEVYGPKMKRAALHLKEYWGNEARCGWYSGHMLTCVRNNNGLESTWKYFKEDCTLYKRCNLISLLRRVLTWVETISGAYAPNIPETDRRSFRCDPMTSQSRGEWEAAYLFAMEVRNKSRYRFFSTPNVARTYVFLRTTSREDTGDDENDDDIKKAEAMGKFKQWQTLDGINSFAMYISTLHDTHVVSYNQTTKIYYCTCYYFCKKLVCNHTVCARRHIEPATFKWPDNTRPGAFERRRGDSRKPGRPKTYPIKTSKFTRNGEFEYFPVIPGDSTLG
jgi:hypothetical protein